MPMHYFEIGKRNCGKSEQQRRQLRMTPEQYAEFSERQIKALDEVIRLEKELAKAREVYFKACIAGEAP